MKAKDLKQLTKTELSNRVKELRGRIRDLRFNIKTRQNAKVRDLRKAKQDLARTLTILAQLNEK
ncbi:MAG: 50S ribosomal protein L29 [Patescibacteria group bacterium]